MVYYVLLQILLLTPVLLVCPFEDDLFEFSQKIETEEDITKFLNWYDIEKSQVSNCQAKTLWIYKTNITSHNEKIMVSITITNLASISLFLSIIRTLKTSQCSYSCLHCKIQYHY